MVGTLNNLMFQMPSFMVHLMKLFTCPNLKVLSILNILIMFANCGKPFMGSSKLLDNGLNACLLHFSRLVLKDLKLIVPCSFTLMVPFKLTVWHMLMILSLRVIILNSCPPFFSYFSNFFLLKILADLIFSLALRQCKLVQRWPLAYSKQIYP